MIDNKTSLVSNFQDIAYKVHRSNAFGNDMSGIVYIAAGMGYTPLTQSKADYLDKRYQEVPMYFDRVYDNWLIHKEEALKRIEKMPSHYEFLKNTIYK
jgi:hypothetical protein